MKGTPPESGVFTTLVLFLLTYNHNHSIYFLMIDPHDLDSPIFSSEQLAHAIDRSIQLVKKWQGAGISVIRADDDPGSAGRGRRSRYTLRTIIELALMAEMTQWGVPAEIARESANEFAQSGEGDTGDGDEREPGKLFKIGNTWLVFHDRLEGAKLVNVRGSAPFEWPNYLASTAHIIDCRIVIDRVIARLSSMEAGNA